MFPRITALRYSFALLILVLLIVLSAVLRSVALTPLPEPSSPETTELLDISGRLITRLYIENRIKIPVAEMPQYLLDAIVAIEDDRFYHHKGIDPLGVTRAFIRNLLSGTITEGGSTLSQQLARNLYLSHERTLSRKWYEAVLTIKLEHQYSKQEILGLYWNTIYLGNGLYGVEMTAQTYFGKPARKLTLAEAALLAAIPRAPEYYAPTNHPTAAVNLRNLVLDKMRAKGFITAEQSQSAKREELHLISHPDIAEEAPHFVDYVLRDLQARYPDIARVMPQGGFRIYTTLDLNLQHLAERSVREYVPPGRPDPESSLQPQAALVVMDPETGQVRAMVGGRDRSIDRNRALEPYQITSIFKPIVYAAALKTRAYTAASTQPDRSVSFPNATGEKPWRPKNYTGEYTYQPTTMRDALRKSLNAVTAQWIDTIRPGPVIDLARQMGISGPLENNLTIGLGSAAASPLEIAGTYTTLANGGLAVSPSAIVRIESHSGRLIAEQENRRFRALDPGIAFIITDMLKETLRPGGTAADSGPMLQGHPAAGKTGTDDNMQSAWFAGYTPELVTFAWVGDDHHTSERPLTGAAAAAPLWAGFMHQAPQGTPYRDWSAPSHVVKRQVCSLSGLLPNATCPLTSEWFLKGTVPVVVDQTRHEMQVSPDSSAAPGLLSPAGG